MNKYIASLLSLLSLALLASCTVPAIVTQAPATIPVLQVDPHPRYSGVAPVDAVAHAILENEVQAVKALAQFTDIGCTTQNGLGGPPKCQAGQAEGTVVSVLPVWAQEGTYLTPETMDTLRFDVGNVYAVYRVPDDAVRDNFTPPGDYGILFLNAELFPATITVFVTDGRIVRLSYNMDADPAQTLARVGGEMLYHAPDAAIPIESESD